MDFSKISRHQTSVFKGRIRTIIEEHISRYLCYVVGIVVKENGKLEKYIPTDDEEYIDNVVKALQDDLMKMVIKAAKNVVYDKDLIRTLVFKTVLTKNEDTTLLRKVRAFLKL